MIQIIKILNSVCQLVLRYEKGLNSILTIPMTVGDSAVYSWGF